MDPTKMTLSALRELARKAVGAKQSLLRTRADIVAALESAGVLPGAKRAHARPAGKGAKGSGKAAARPAPKAKVSRTSSATKAKAKVKPKGKPKPGSAKGTAAAKPRRGAKVASPAAARKPTRAAGAGKPAPGRKASAAPRGRRRPAGPPQSDGLDPEGYFIARVRGEEAVRLAPHPMTETDDTQLRAALEAGVDDDEGLGELPWSYGDDAFVALPRDPRTLFVYWDLARDTVARAFAGIDHPRAQLRVFAAVGGGGWELVRVVDFALESRCFYVHDLAPGRVYRAEIHVMGGGKERQLGNPSNEMGLPPSGPSPVVDDRFASIPWDLPLDRWQREAQAGGAFPEELRDLLARLSDGSGTGPSRGAREAGPAPGAPTSPRGGWGSGSGLGREGR
jgi:uncharacterized protein